MEEEEALRNYCRTMISRVRNKRQCPREHKHGGAKGSNWPETERQVASAHRGSNLHVLERNIDPASPHVGQGPAVPHAPFQLVTMLRIKTLKEEMRRVMKHPCVTVSPCLDVITAVSAFMCSYLLTGCRGGAARSRCVQRVRAGTGFSGLENFYQEEKDTTADPSPKVQTKHTFG